MTTELLSETALEPSMRRRGWFGIGLLWTLITALGTGIGWSMASGARDLIAPGGQSFLSEIVGPLGGLLIGGILVGVGQALILRLWIPRGETWAWATAAGSLLGLICTAVINLGLLALLLAPNRSGLAQSSNSDAESWGLLWLGVLFLYWMAVAGVLGMAAATSLFQSRVLHRSLGEARGWIQITVLGWVLAAIGTFIFQIPVATSNKPVLEAVVQGIHGVIAGAILGGLTGWRLVGLLQIATTPKGVLAGRSPRVPGGVWALISLLFLFCLAGSAAWVGLQPCGQLDVLVGASGCQAVWATGGDQVTSLAFSPSGTILAAGSTQGVINAWRTTDRTLLFTAKSPSPAWHSTVAFSSAQGLLALASDVRTLWYFSQTKGQVPQEMGYYPRMEAMSFSPDANMVAFAGEANYDVDLMQMSTGKVVQSFKGHTGAIRSLAFSSDGALLASGSDDTTGLVWRVADGKRLYALKGIYNGGWGDIIVSLAFSPDNRLLASGQWAGEIRIWDATDGTLLRVIPAHSNTLDQVAFSPDGTTLASCGGGDGQIKLWQVTTGALIRVLDGHMADISRLAFSPDGKMLAASGYDTDYTQGVILLWQLTQPR